MSKEKSDNKLTVATFGSQVKGYAKTDMKRIEDSIDSINGRTGIQLSQHGMKLDEFMKNELSQEVVESHILPEGGELFFKMTLQ